ncbi:MAG: GlxA family transcriptional regulator [Rhodobacter sp.]|nr:GlxA family transcriptional regulator [Rhodobacter sp.]MCA3514271.1 GlxA family transcriptional regulator [Rhodobacter sp.]MCA3521523.1 GlxA family transcriptional regulator [Rhodobacter sp.]MCA3523104.1 GlxA family transcriptional regulator [Rhodobacter sp.]MCA3527107.1 GlxA family transcriptional regulator [Rhodobacter sp.]
MTPGATIFTPSRSPLTIAALVLPQASILEVASVLDPLRAANRHLGQDSYRWRVVSPDGRAVPLTCGIELPSSGPLSAAAGADALIVIAGFRQAEVATRQLIRDLRRMAPRFHAIGGIDAGAWVLARAGLLDGHRATVHWEDLEDLAAAHPEVEVLPQRFVLSGARFTAGGAAPAADLMLHLIRSRHGAAVALQVAASFITTARDGADPQISAPSADMRLDPRVAAALARMEARLDSPEPAAAIARHVGVSPRRLEGLFRADLGTTPAAHALDLRLQAARRMLTDTRHAVQEVALRTGFTSPSAFARAFRRRFGTSPLRAREVAGPGAQPPRPDRTNGSPETDGA